MTPESIPGRLIPEQLDLLVLPLRLEASIERDQEQVLLELRKAA
jgi:hypothetical protein